MNSWKLISKKRNDEESSRVDRVWVFKPSEDEITRITQDLQMSIALLKCGVVTRGETTYYLEEIQK